MEITREIIKRETQRFIDKGGEVTYLKLTYSKESFEFEQMITREASEDVTGMITRRMVRIANDKVF